MDISRKDYERMIKSDLACYGLSQFHTSKGLWSISEELFNLGSDGDEKTTYWVTLINSDTDPQNWTGQTLDQVIDRISEE